MGKLDRPAECPVCDRLLLSAYAWTMTGPTEVWNYACSHEGRAGDMRQRVFTVRAINGALVPRGCAA